MQSLEQNPFKFSLNVVLVPLGLVFTMLLVFWVELRFGYDFTDHGVLPRTIGGLQGVVFSPFIHSSLEHFYNNSIPTLVLTGGLFYFYRPVAFKVLVLLLLLSGMGTWLIGRQAYHIGASGMVYALASFLFFKGIWSGYYRLIAFSLIVIFLYGSLVWGTMPLNPGMSWEGHLSGFISGLILALFIRKDIARPVKYEWEKTDFEAENDPFLRHFDENGNFIEELPEEDIDDEEVVLNKSANSSDEDYDHKKDS